jgi:3-oxoacyl-[acyl-carrier-protein] synthase-1
MAQEVVVIGCGMMTSVGLSPAEAAASTRSRTVRLTEIAWLDRRYKGYVVGVVPDDGLPELHPDLEKEALSYRELRMLQLATMPLQQALVSLPKNAGPVSLLLGLPEHHTAVPLDPTKFLARVTTQADAARYLPSGTALPQGRAAGLLAVKEAYDRLAQGQGDFYVAGGVDSQVDLYVLGTLDVQRRVRTERNSDGFAPAEGSGFVLLASAAGAKKYGLSPLARVAGCAAGREPGHFYNEDEPYKGEGLAQTFEQLFAAAGGAGPVGCIYASFNGEHYWAKEFSVAMLRHREKFADDYQMEHPAECFGDLGSAHGGVMVGLASLGLRDGYLRSPTLVYSSSDFGERAAVLLTRP